MAPESPATAVRVRFSVSEIPPIGLTKTKRRKLSPTCVQVVRQTGFFNGAYITEKTRLRLDPSG